MPSITIKPEVTHSGKGRAFGSVKAAKEYANNYAFVSLTNVDTLKMFSELDAKDTRTVVTFTMDEIKALGYEGETPGSAAQRFNSVFATLRIPFKASVGASPEAKALGKITSNRSNTTKKGEAGTPIQSYKMDWVSVGRTGDHFDYKLYATTEAGKVSTKGENIGKAISHEDAPKGMVIALENWVADVGQDLPEELIEKIGLSEKITELAERDEQPEEEEEGTEEGTEEQQ